ncbi:MAG: MBL fold metallo-hydrolase [Clostridiaceae bacterium]|jgi:L-ascorbate metabolism protein UlaG (beta-lactamase superfamily)|nr:MBL fold metallo-hydrolase [Clostridiaceae bacterium]
MLNFLGIGSAFNTVLGNTSAFIKNKSSLFLIDCGSTVFNRIQKLDLLADIRSLYITITHTHPDHIGSLGELILYSHYYLNHKPKIFFPNSSLLASILTNMGVDSEFYELISKPSTQIFDENLNTVDLTFIQSSHVKKIPSYSIILKYGVQIIYYSGDSYQIPISIIEGLEKEYIDILYQDTCGLDYEDNPHLSLNKLAECIKPQLRSKIYCMHVDQQFDKSKAISLGFNVSELVEGL